MLKKTFFAALIVFVMAAGLVRAEEKTAARFVILPFEIISKDDLGYLGQKIPDTISKNLEADGASVVVPDKAKTGAAIYSEADGERIRKIIAENRAKYAVIGSLSFKDDKLDISSWVVPGDGGKPFNVKSEGKGIESIFSAVNSLSSQISEKTLPFEKVDEIRIEGTKRIEKEAILTAMETKVGSRFREIALSDDLKRVYRLGYFDDIRIETEKGKSGRVVIISVRERPTVQKVTINISSVYKPEEIQEEIKLKSGGILNIDKVQDSIRRIREMMIKKNYHSAKVEYKVNPLKENLVELVFDIDPGEKIYVQEIKFEGNENFSKKELLAEMDSSEKWFMTWLTSAGEYNKDIINQDSGKLTAFYHNKGYAKARIGEPVIDMDGETIIVTYKIDEGPQYKVGKVGIEGDLIQPPDKLMADFKITKEEIYNRESIQQDIMKLTDIYGDEGYAEADIYPRIDYDEEAKTTNITFEISKGQPLYIGNIHISGNTKTRDKVIRRQLQIYEQSLYKTSKLKRSIRNLHYLDYFEEKDLKVDTVKGEKPGTLDLVINVKEKPTGTFSFGGGYSSVDNLFVMAAINQRNLFGKGQILNLQAEVGGTSTRYNLGFTEPWLFDIPLSAGFDLYNWERDYDDYDKQSVGGALRASYPVWDFTRVQASYGYEVTELTDIVADASDDIKDLAGKNSTSRVSGNLKYDSRDRVFNPTHGAQYSLGVEYAGGFLGGDIAYIKNSAETGLYFPIFWKFTGFIHGEVGNIVEQSSGVLPDYERFYLGGINSVRGYKWRDISTLDDKGKEIGGNKYLQGNVELLFPIVESAGVVGLFFFDTGDVYAKDEDVEFSNIHYTTGYGLRWYSPMGPIRIEYGYVLDDNGGKQGDGRWEFTMGAVF
ncbi:outer membrane protein assembly factor BamA [Desulforegula conservatrix]|uniref:outer membrane protein assembly factor BamA n=1 Tax=Desulforegula conservatrix TaxID=153026 RepID=UPI0003FC5FB7|nr:outer membrane protein assembly factor BamA [Desulforegula conservatrix]